MKRSQSQKGFLVEIEWDSIKWIFEPDGALRDVYVQEVSIEDWEKLIDLLNDEFAVKFSVGNDCQPRIDKAYVLKYLRDETGNLDSPLLDIPKVAGWPQCHFFLPDEIEFSIGPDEVRSLDDYRSLETFLTRISACLERQVTLSQEGCITFPLIKIDTEKGISKVLTEEEAVAFYERDRGLFGLLKCWMMDFVRIFLPSRFRANVISSANSPHTSTDLSENIW